jgi:sec-independent protein translocase protein TatB
MFDVGFWELVLIGVVALVVLGPERLPTAARTVGLLLGKLRRTVNDVKAEIEHELHVEDIRRAAREESAKLTHSLDDIKSSLLEHPATDSPQQPPDQHDRKS